MARDIIIKGNTYSVAKIDDVFEQTYLMTRFAPILGGAVNGDVSGLFDKIGTLPKDILKEIYFGLLRPVKRKDGKSFVNICVNDSLMYNDISMMDGFEIAKASFMENYGDFLGENGLISTVK